MAAPELVREELTLPELEAWGESLARTLTRPCVITLSGDLGTGKTTLARALCRGFGVTDISAVTSPTFAILQEYPAGAFSVAHADLYRLGNDSDLDALGWEEILDNAQVLLVEWPERTQRAWPSGTLHISLSYAASDFSTRNLVAAQN